MKRVVFLAWGAQQGITLVEILVALAIFAIVAIGTLGAVGVANVGGLLEGFPVAFAANRTAKDITAATVYLQGLHEHLAKLGAGSLTTGTYPFAPSPSPLPPPFDFPRPSGAPYQLSWTELVVVIQQWDWYDPTPSIPDNGDERYCLIDATTSDATTCPPDATSTPDDQLLRVQSTLTWQLKNSTRTVTVERFLEPNP